MIRQLRNIITKNKYAQYVLWGTILLGFVAGSFLYRSNTDTRIFARVDGREISLREAQVQVAQYEERLQAIVQQYRMFGPQVVSLIVQQLGDPREQAINDLVTNILLEHLAHRSGLGSWPDSFVSSQLRSPAFLRRLYGTVIPVFAYSEDGTRIDKDKLNKFVQRTGSTIEELDTKLENALTIQFMQNAGLLAGYQPVSVRTYQALAKQGSRTIQTLTVPFALFEDRVRAQDIGMDELQEYWRSQNDASKVYWSPEKRTATIYTFMPEAFGITVTDDEVAQTYEARKELYRDAAASTDDKPVYLPLKKVEKEIKAQLMSERFGQRFEQEAQRVVRQRKSSPEVFDAFVKEKKAVKREMTTAQESDTNDLEAMIFGLSRAGMAQARTRRSNTGLEGVIVVLDRIVPSVEIAFDDIQETVREDYIRSSAQQAHTQALADIQVGIESGKALKDLAAEGYTSASYTVQLGDTQSEDALKKAGLSAARIGAMIHPGSFAIERMGESATCIVATAVDGLDREKAAVEARVYPSGQVPESGSIYRSLVAYLHKHATITIQPNA